MNSPLGEGLYTNMNAIRRDEKLDHIHSIYVDQWDWEKIIGEGDRNLETLKDTVCIIYSIFKDAELLLAKKYPFLKPQLPEAITFITSQELYEKYPDKSAKERESAFAKETGAFFLIGIGDHLTSGERHDGRAPDYDDWSLNGDLLFYNTVHDEVLELSSMGIRVDQGDAAGSAEEIREKKTAQVFLSIRSSSGRETASDHGRRNRPVQNLSVPSEEIPHRRGAEQHLA